VNKIPKQLPILVMVLLCWHWSWPLWFGSYSWIVTVTTLQACLVMWCNKLTSESWATAVMIIEVVCVMINTTLWWLCLHKEPYQYHIMLSAFIIELLIITCSLGAGVGRIRNDRLHANHKRMASIFNSAHGDSGCAEVAK